MVNLLLQTSRVYLAIQVTPGRRKNSWLIRDAKKSRLPTALNIKRSYMSIIMRINFT